MGTIAEFVAKESDKFEIDKDLETMTTEHQRSNGSRMSCVCLCGCVCVWLCVCVFVWPHIFKCTHFQIIDIGLVIQVKHMFKTMCTVVVIQDVAQVFLSDPFLLVEHCSTKERI